MRIKRANRFVYLIVNNNNFYLNYCIFFFLLLNDTIYNNYRHIITGKKNQKSYEKKNWVFIMAKTFYIIFIDWRLWILENIITIICSFIPEFQTNKLQ